MSDEPTDSAPTTTRRGAFPAVAGGYPFPRLEQEVLERWRRDDVFRRTVARPPAPGRRDWVFYEGPPTANNVPHVGHVVTRVVKDLFPRFRTMQGFRVPRKAGWDTHGLPVEIEVEKRLGFSGKQQIEAYGIAEFNRQCLESVHTYERQWRAMTERVAYWIDLDHAYFTYTNEYVESVWWALATLAGKGLLDQGYKIQPYCARCGTTLSSHEVAQNYKDADDPSVWVLFPARPDQALETVGGERWQTPEGLALVAWTTTPWTLTAHVGLTVHPEMTYRVIRHPAVPGRLLLVGEDLETPIPLEIEADGKRKRLDLRGEQPLARFTGRALEGLRYDRPFATGEPDQTAAPFEEWQDAPPSDAHGWRVVLGDYVTTTEGTGLVHTAPPFGEDDYRTGGRYGLPFFLTVDGEGHIVGKPGIEPFAGQWFKDADPPITRDLRARGLLLHGDRTHHNYPFCWRCDSPLLYRASLSWFVLTTRARDELVAKNRTIDWHPEHVGEGRFGNWLENVVDWALSRKRYWGTPLPIWVCDDCGAREVIGSYRELFARAGRELPADPYDREQLDPHRPFIDEVTWDCRHQGCAGIMRRVEEVIDAWFDSGSMPFAQHHYMGEPIAGVFDPEAGVGFPADLISEAVDQTRGWFYTLHALGVLLFDSVAFRHCVVLGHVNDEQGRKMSKRLGNVVDPMGVIEETGADALRWYFCVNNPEQPSRFSAGLVREAAQRFLLPLWNALSFFTIYANLDDWHPGQTEAIAFARRPSLDRWILLSLDRVVRETTAALEGYAVSDAARGIEALVDDLTNWYIRRSRDRFWAGAGAGEAKESAYQTLYEVLTTLSRLLAPFTPFVAEVLHSHLIASQDPEAADSVHLESWPAPGERAEPELAAGMAAVQRIVNLGHSARNTHSLRTRQPLAAVTLVTTDPQLPALVAPHEGLLADELNVHEIRWAEDRATYVRHQVRPNFRVVGKRLGKLVPQLKAALEAADGDALAAELEGRGALTLELAGESVVLAPEEARGAPRGARGDGHSRRPRAARRPRHRAHPELVAEGLAREVVHRIQTARKDADLDYAARIRVRYAADEELGAAIATHRDWIAGETLAVEARHRRRAHRRRIRRRGRGAGRGTPLPLHRRHRPTVLLISILERISAMSGIFKAYDVRGIYPGELDETRAEQIGRAFWHVLAADGFSHGRKVVVSHDMRSHSIPLEAALVRGLRAAGLDVVEIGMVTTPMNYFAVGHLGAAGGVQVTASHNPAEYNGFKFSRHGALPVSGDHGIALMEQKVEEGDLPTAEAPGSLEHADVFEAYKEHVLGFLEPADGRRLKVAVDVANGMGTIYRPMLDAMEIDLVPLFFELDGTFPNHEANPLRYENLEDLADAVREHHADLGVEFDGDADRSAFVDETGKPIGSDLITALIAGELLARAPGSAIIYDLRSSRAVAEYVREKGGVPVRERVGHSFMKQTLRDHDGVFGGELAGHYYFRDNFYADSSLMAMIEIVNLLRRSGKTMSQLVRPLERYAKSPETNFEVADKEAKMRELAERFADGKIDHLDGITVEYPDWWFNVRPSNTEPYLRLVMEAADAAALERHMNELVPLLGPPV